MEFWAIFDQREAHQCIWWFEPSSGTMHSRDLKIARLRRRLARCLPWAVRGGGSRLCDWLQTWPGRAAAAARAAGQRRGSPPPPAGRPQPGSSGSGGRSPPFPESGRLIGVSRETGGRSCRSCPGWCAGARAPEAGARSGRARAAGRAGACSRRRQRAGRPPQSARARVPAPALQRLQTAGRARRGTPRSAPPPPASAWHAEWRRRRLLGDVWFARLSSAPQPPRSCLCASAGPRLLRNQWVGTVGGGGVGV